ncbi:hypothetical protein [Burkholderia ubonensis]|uniref:hypothetical protein n=1 Tax=Burkholderia ubonensis TaxID=101571 RepID=UPI00091E4C9C|nr:hypothetical protein [Burkholderia ubonensis]OJA84432.1 hypothetical protein BGV49_21935 [Burkholderia ubonensis]
MAYFDLAAQADRIPLASSVEESLLRMIGLFNGLTSSKLESDRLKAIYLFATEGPDVRLAVIMDCYIANLHIYEVVDGPIFTAGNIKHIRELLCVADEFQAKLLADGRPPTIGDNLKVLYCGRPAPRTDDKIQPHDAAEELLKHFWASSVPRPRGEEFLRLFESV